MPRHSSSTAPVDPNYPLFDSSDTYQSGGPLYPRSMRLMGPVIARFFSLYHTFIHASASALVHQVTHRHYAPQMIHHPSHTRCLRIDRLIFPTRVCLFTSSHPEIYMFCATTIYGPAFLYTSPVTTPMMVLCQVCRYWRSLLLSMPTIWSSASAIQCDLGPSHLLFYKMWPGRSRLTPLWDIWEIPRYSSNFHTVDSVSCLFMSEIHRWRFVSIRLMTPHLLYHMHLLTTSNNVAPMLNGLELILPSGAHLDLWTLTSKVSTFRALKQVSLESIDDLPRSITNIPWQQITHFKINGRSVGC